MRHGTMIREQAIALCGITAVTTVERLNCEPTSRVQTDGDTDVEFAANVTTPQGVLTAYYYLTEEEAQYEDGADVDWQIQGYELR